MDKYIDEIQLIVVTLLVLWLIVVVWVEVAMGPVWNSFFTLLILLGYTVAYEYYVKVKKTR